MDVPHEVLIHNATLGMKGSVGTLLTISPDGYYEVNCRFGENTHRVLLPIVDTVLISREAEAVFAESEEIER